MKQAYLQMHFAILLWGFTAIFGKLIELDEGMLVWYRMLISALSMLVFLIFRQQMKWPSKRELLGIAGIGAVIAFHWVTFYGAIKASNVSVAISCFSSVALFTALLDPVFKGKLPRKKEIIPGLLVMAGIYIIFRFQQFYLEGILLSLVSALLASVFTILNKRISLKYDPSMLTFMELGTGFLVLSAFLPAWFAVNESSFSLPSASDWIYLLLLSIFCTTLAFTLSLYALKKLDAFTMNLSVNLEPLYSIILAILLFKEHQMLNPWFYAGAAIILLTVVLHAWISYKSVSEKLPENVNT